MGREEVNMSQAYWKMDYFPPSTRQEVLTVLLCHDSSNLPVSTHLHPSGARETHATVKRRLLNTQAGEGIHKFM